MRDKFKITVQDYLTHEKIASKSIAHYLERQIDIFEHLFDVQQKLFFIYFKASIDPYYEISENEQIIMQCYHKSINLIYVAHKLILIGNFGAANSIFRQIFEYIIFGKFYHINNEELLISGWNDNKVDVHKTVLIKLIQPDKGNLFRFWQLFSNHTHATHNAYQLNTHFEIDCECSFEAYMTLLMLLRCNYHLLNSCYINNRLRYRVNKFEKNKNETILHRRIANIAKKEIARDLSVEGLSFIKSYEKKWIFKF